MAATAIPVHVPTNTANDSHIVERINADGTMHVRDAATGYVRQLRLAVIVVGGQHTLVAVGGDS